MVKVPDPNLVKVVIQNFNANYMEESQNAFNCWHHFDENLIEHITLIRSLFKLFLATTNLTTMENSYHQLKYNR